TAPPAAPGPASSHGNRIRIGGHKTASAPATGTPEDMVLAEEDLQRQMPGPGLRPGMPRLGHRQATPDRGLRQTMRARALLADPADGLRPRNRPRVAAAPPVAAPLADREAAVARVLRALVDRRAAAAVVAAPVERGEEEEEGADASSARQTQGIKK